MVWIDLFSFTNETANGGYTVYNRNYEKDVGVLEQGSLIFNDQNTILKMDNCDLETKDGVYIGQLTIPRSMYIIDPSNQRKVGEFYSTGEIYYYSDYRAVQPGSNGGNEADEADEANEVPDDGNYDDVVDELASAVDDFSLDDPSRPTT